MSTMPIQEGRGLKDIFSGSLCYELERGGRRSSGGFTEKMQLYRVCVEDFAVLPRERR